MGDSEGFIHLNDNGTLEQVAEMWQRAIAAAKASEAIADWVEVIETQETNAADLKESENVCSH